MNNPKIYGFCPAGCKWETVHRNEFEASKSAYPLFENEKNHTFSLINTDINLLAENPYKDITQHFIIYDGTPAPSSTRTWKVKLCGIVYVNGEAKDSDEVTFESRSQFAHEVELIIKSIHFSDNMQSLHVYTNQKKSSGQSYLSLVCKPNDGDIVTCDLYIMNVGYPYMKEDGTTTSKVDGCENTRVYSIGYSKGFFTPTYSKEETDELLSTKANKEEVDEIREGYAKKGQAFDGIIRLEYNDGIIDTYDLDNTTTAGTYRVVIDSTNDILGNTDKEQYILLVGISSRGEEIAYTQTRISNNGMMETRSRSNFDEEWSEWHNNMLGDIDTALDELHNYATSLIGGEA